MTKKKYRLKKKNFFQFVILIICFVTMFFLAIQIIEWSLDNEKTNEILDEVQNKMVIEEVEIKEEEVRVQDEQAISSEDLYWEFIDTDFLSVDLSKLKDDNEDVVGFLQVLNTNINYPFVQTTNNSYYLTHDLYRNSNGGGWVFLDYRNQDNFDNKNSIIYAHGRENHTMFGTLKNVLDESWYQNEENYVVKLATQTQSYVYQVFSVYRIENTNDYIQTEFQSDPEYLRFLTKLQERSIADFQTTVSASDKILTLSTCYNDYEKVVLHAKLIKQVTLS